MTNLELIQKIHQDLINTVEAKQSVHFQINAVLEHHKKLAQEEAEEKK